MLIPGEWLVFADGVSRPVVEGDILTPDGHWVRLVFLVDTGTVVCAEDARLLGLGESGPAIELEGLGGRIASFSLDTKFRLPRTDGRAAVVNGPISVAVEVDALGMSVLGRDVLSNFTLILDRRTTTLLLVAPRHRYLIVED